MIARLVGRAAFALLRAPAPPEPTVDLNRLHIFTWECEHCGATNTEHGSSQCFTCKKSSPPPVVGDPTYCCDLSELVAEVAGQLRGLEASAAALVGQNTRLRAENAELRAQATEREQAGGEPE